MADQTTTTTATTRLERIAESGTSSSAVSEFVVSDVAFGKVKVHIQGDIKEKEKKAVFLTVHDCGSNHSSMRDFVDSQWMESVRSRSVFIHVDIPGQDDNCDELDDSFAFPTLLEMGENLLPKIVDSLKVALVVGVGEGAGANILVRFGLKCPERVLGLVLINLVSAGVSFLDSLKERFGFGSSSAGSRRRQSQQTTTGLELIREMKGIESKELIDVYKERIARINAKNMAKYVDAYMNRKELSGADFKLLDVLLVVGAKSPFCAGVDAVYAKCDKAKAQLLKTDAADALRESPDKLAQSLLLFVKGLGLLTTCNPTQTPTATATATTATTDGSNPKVTTLGAIGRRRTLSMEEYDLPRMRRLSLTK